MAALPFQTDRGAGDHGTCGLIVLKPDETMEVEFAPLFARAGVGLYHSRLPSAPDVSAASLAAMADEIPRAASLLPDNKLQTIGYGCTSGATIIGSDRVEAMVRAHHPEVDTVTDPLRAALAAFGHLGVRRIGFLTPYAPEVSGAMRQKFEAEGLVIAAFGSFEEPSEAAVARISEASTEAALIGLGRSPDVDAVFASCTNLRSFSIIESVERTIGKPVVTSNQAFAWHLLSSLGRARAAKGPGRLFGS